MSRGLDHRGPATTTGTGMQPVPVIYEHAARCLGRTPWEVSRDAGLLADAHLAAWRIYRHAPVTIGIDLYNPEPEAWGARVGEPPGTAVPAIAAHPLADAAGLAGLRPLDPARDGRLPLLLDAVRRVRAALPAGVPVSVPVQGAVSCASGLLGMEALMLAAQDDAEALAAGLRRLVAMLEPWVAAIAAAGAGITIFESAAAPPMLSPRLFRRLAAQPLAELAALAARSAGAPPFLVMGGDIAPIVADLAACGCGGLLVPAETDQVKCLAALAAHPQLRLRLNLPVGAVVGGDATAYTAALARARALAAGRPGAVLGTGVLPWDADPQAIAARIGG